MVNETKSSVSFKVSLLPTVPRPPSTDADFLSTFQTEFAVDMTCQSCVSAVKTALAPIDGIEKYDIDLENKQVIITGRAAPSILCKALKDTGRQVLVRGSGTASGTSEVIRDLLSVWFFLLKNVFGPSTRNP